MNFWLVRDQSQHSGVVLSGLKPPMAAFAAEGEIAATSRCEFCTEKLIDVFRRECSEVWRGGHEERGEETASGGKVAMVPGAASPLPGAANTRSTINQLPKNPVREICTAPLADRSPARMVVSLYS